MPIFPLTKLLGRRMASTSAGEPAALAQAREDAEQLIAQGNALEDMGDIAVALDRYRDAVKAAPTFSRAHMNVANALNAQNRLDEAVAAARDAVRCEPGYAPARFNLGLLLAAREDCEAAKHELYEALRLDNELLEARVALADVFETLGDVVEAESELRMALRARPSFAGAAHNLAWLLIRQRRLDDAEEWMMRTLELAPALGENALTSLLTSLNVNDEIDNATVFRTHVWIGQSIERAAGLPFDFWSNDPDPDRRLRVGYVSGDFRNHPIAAFLRPVLERYDRMHFEVHCYSNFGEPNSVAESLRPLVDHWHQIQRLSDERVIESVRADKIDVLVDLSGHTQHGRLHVFARHPAPVQVTWLGYLNTSGLTSIDYRICDAHTDPAGTSEAIHTERLFRMPFSQWCYSAPHGGPVVQQPHTHHPNVIMFGSFNQYERISDPCLDVWCRILDRVPAARFQVLDIRNENVRKALLERIALRGIDVGRIVTRGRESLAAYFTAIGDVDVAFDSWPYNGATTTLNTLWMGVPVVALKGQRGISRSSYSILESLAMPELIADTPDMYIEINVRLAQDAAWRRELRTTLRERLRLSPLMDAPRFARDLEVGYRQMWRAWCNAQNKAK